MSSDRIKGVWCGYSIKFDDGTEIATDTGCKGKCMMQLEPSTGKIYQHGPDGFVWHGRMLPADAQAAAEPFREISGRYADIANYLQHARRGRLSVPGFPSFTYESKDGTAFLRWNGECVVLFSVYSDDGGPTADVAAIARGTFPNGNQRQTRHLLHVNKDVDELIARGNTPHQIVLHMLKRAVEVFDPIPPRNSASAAAEPKPDIVFKNPNATGAFQALLGLVSAKGRTLKLKNRLWSLLIEDVYHSASYDKPGEHNYGSSGFVTLQLKRPGEQDVKITVRTSNFGRTFDVRVGGNHLGNGGLTGEILDENDMRGVKTPAQFVQRIVDTLGLKDNDDVTVKRSVVPESFLRKAVDGYLEACLDLTNDEDSDKYDEDSGEGPSLATTGHTVSDIDAASREKITRVMRNFLEQVYSKIETIKHPELNATQIGHDAFLLSGGWNGGFKERSYDRNLGDFLAVKCEAIFPGHVNAYKHNKSVHIDT